jgi:hypothetical protein
MNMISLFLFICESKIAQEERSCRLVYGSTQYNTFLFTSLIPRKNPFNKHNSDLLGCNSILFPSE